MVGSCGVGSGVGLMVILAELDYGVVAQTSNWVPGRRCTAAAEPGHQAYIAVLARTDSWPGLNLSQSLSARLGFTFITAAAVLVAFAIAAVAAAAAVALLYFCFCFCS